MQWFLIKVAGSTSCVFDFSNASVKNTNELREFIKQWCIDANKSYIKPHGFDKRLGLYAWSLMAETKDYGFQHMVWIYSQHEQQPYLSEDFPLWLSDEEVEKEQLNNIPIKG